MGITLSNAKKTYLGLDPQGRMRWALDAHIGAIQFKETGGPWQDIDAAIEVPDTGGFAVKFTQVPYLGRIGNDSHRRIYPDRTNSNCWIQFEKPFASMPTPTRSDRWFYWDFPNALMGVRFDNMSIKFGFRLKNASAPTSITLPFSTQGITRDGRFLKHNGKVIGELRKPVATDANGDERDCTIIFGTGEVTISLDTTGLTFPIEIDPTLDLQVGANLDDVHEKESDGAISDAITVKYIGSTISSARYWGADRWVSGSLPALGDTITVAYAELYFYTSGFDDVNGNWHFQKAASPAQFVVANFNVTSRTRTIASTSWIADGVAAGGAGFYPTPSLVTPLQEVIDNYSPTALALIFRPNTDVHKDARAYSHNQGSIYGAKLHIEWTAGGGIPTDCMSAKLIAGKLI